MEVSAEDLRTLLLLSRTPGIRMRGVAAVLEEGASAREILKRVALGENRSWKDALEATRQRFDPEKELEKAERLGIQIIPFGSPQYPFLLRESHDPPFVLYLKGNLEEADQAAVALVGSRHPSLYGMEQARHFARKLAGWGLTVVSGFARGIDRLSHEGALEVSYGRTVAVLGSGLDVIYPKDHGALYEEITARGALVSEFALGTPPLAENFPKRNRIIAGLSLGVLVIEAHSRSGSLITAHLAAEEGREVFALPGRVDQLGSRGTHRLIKEGAGLVETPEEVFDALTPQLWPLASVLERSTDVDEEDEGFLSFFEGGALTIDQVAKKGGRAVAWASTLLTRLELKQRVRRRLDGRYEVVRARE